MSRRRRGEASKTSAVHWHWSAAGRPRRVKTLVTVISRNQCNMHSGVQTALSSDGMVERRHLRASESRRTSEKVWPRRRSNGFAKSGSRGVLGNVRHRVERLTYESIWTIRYALKRRRAIDALCRTRGFDDAPRSPPQEAPGKTGAGPLHDDGWFERREAPRR